MGLHFSAYMVTELPQINLKLCGHI